MTPSSPNPDILKAPGATGDYHTNIASKGVTAVDALTDPARGYEFGFLHIKAVDDAGHDRNLALKIKFLEEIDRMLAAAVERLRQHDRDGERYSIAVTGDHSTPYLTGDHSCEPVPFVLARVRDLGGARSGDWPSDGVERFSEHAAHAGFLGRFVGGETMEVVKRLACAKNAA